MHSFMATSAQGNQVRIVILALLAAQLLVVDLKVLSGTTDLTLPAIASQYLVCGAVRKARDQAAGAVAWGESGSRSLFGHFVQKCLPLFAGQKSEEPRN